mmetsp:Transcript_29583/g.62184  ORF Transcript_29583/g.62184 Transcript_29583/m.62184 type:complete len:192 (+) Transcript_29583:134-709(+)
MVSPSFNKKRERSPPPRSSASDMTSFAGNDEYENAVAFLREFHSRRAAALHSTSLNTISECFDDLAGDFSLMVRIDGIEDSREYVLDERKLTPAVPRKQALKKTITMKCLVDLDTETASGSAGESSRLQRSLLRTRSRSELPPRPSTCSYPQKSMASVSSCHVEEIDADNFFGYCCDNPMIKRRCSRLGRA